MKPFFNILALLFLTSAMGLQAQISQQNYVATYSYLNAYGTTHSTEVQFFDGLGRPSQVATNAKGKGTNYVHQLTEYNTKGLPARQWQPVAGSTEPSCLSLSAFESQSHSTYANPEVDDKAYTNITYDALGRTVYTIGPGKDWHNAGKGVSKAYRVNTANELKKYYTNLNGTALFESRYQAGELDVETTTDEDGKSLVVYKDFTGKTVLENRWGSYTYYVYDPKGMLRFVLQPMYQTDEEIELYSYRYANDSKGRCIKKTLPGCDYISYVYDNCDRVAFMQDGNMRDLGKCRFYLYDDYGRQVVQGTCADAAMTGAVNASTTFTGQSADGNGTGYTVPQSVDANNYQLEMVNYYDNYDFLSMSITTQCPSNLAYSGTVSPATGLQTCSVAWYGSTPLFNVTYYNEKGLVIQTKQNFPGNTFLTTGNYYAFPDRPSYTWQAINRKGETHQLDYDYYYYNPSGQPNEIDVFFDDDDVVMKKYDYDGIGRVTSLKQGFPGQTTYTYNSRGFVTDISAPVFKEHLYYADDASSPLYNGNIARQRWRYGTDDWQEYLFGYNNQNWLTSARSIKTSQTDIRDHSFTASYDSNGSPYEITQRGLLDDGSYGVIDSLRFCLDGNQLISITEQVTGPNHTGAFHFVGNSQAGRQYAYDKNGNMTKDLNRKVSSIQYNLLNLPTKMYIDDHIIYHNYDLSGRKLQAVYLSKMPDIGVDIDIDWSDTIDYDRPIIIDTLPHIRPTSLMSSSLMSSVALPDYYQELINYRFRDTLSYCGPFIYRNSKLVQALYDGGCVTMTDNTPQFRFYQCDHLGSVRAVVKTNGEVLQRNAYYPFGGLYQADATDDTYRYKYNGKELDRTFGHNMYDYGARWQDPYLGLFTTIDPLAEKYYHVSPYAYCANNPVNAVDPDGRIISYLNGVNGKSYIYYKGNFYNNHVRLENGHYVPSGKPVFVKESSENYMYRALQALRKMDASQNEYIRKVFDTLSDLDSGHEHMIINQHIKTSYVKPKTGIGSYLFLNFDDTNLNSGDFEGIGLTDYELIGHELKHSYDIQFYKNKRGMYEGVKIEEFETVNFENLIRKEEGNSLRTKYTIKIPEKFWGKVTIWN